MMVTKIIEIVIEKFDIRGSSTLSSLLFFMIRNGLDDQFIKFFHRGSPGMRPG